MIKRRVFLHATLATAGAAIAGCGGNDTDTGGTTSGTDTPRTLEDGAKFFPQSVASGDPRPDSLILWTRVEDTGIEDKDVDLDLEISPDAEFSELLSLNGEASLVVKATAQFDHCVKVRLAGISPGAVYYYRFIYTKGGKYYVSKTGRAKTAPAKDADVNVKFAYVSCQDYIGRFYNAHVRLVKEDLDFFVHLGDYVYETEGDPTFQNTSGRKVEFTDVEGSITLTAGSGDTYHAAKSLSNYRDLYKTYRSDPALQKMHESFAMIATWDDHEFSDDCHGSTASYFDGKEDENDVERRKAANQAWFEYMPVDYLGDPDFSYDAAADYPGDIKIWRDFEFGKHLHLVMTDLRTYRADHLIPEEAFPGAVVADEDTLIAEYGEIPAIARPYVDIDDPSMSAYKDALVTATTAAGADASKVTGNVSALFVNNVVTQLGAPAPIDEATLATLPLGVAYVDAGKFSFFSSIGTRYFSVKPAFDVIADLSYKTKKNQDVLGTEQEEWFLDTMKTSSKTWKVWGNEYCLTPLKIDLSTQAIPDQFKQVFYMNLDAWDGFPGKRSDLIGTLAGLSNVVAITGDIHAFYAATPMTADGSKKIVEFVGSSISSGTFKSLLQGQVAADPVLSKIPGASLLAASIDSLLRPESAGPNPQLGFADSTHNGFVIAEVSADELVTTYYAIAEKEVTKDHYEDDAADLDALFSATKFKVVSGEHELYKEVDGKFQKWNPETQAFE